jgi:hypothetical protein
MVLPPAIVAGGFRGAAARRGMMPIHTTAGMACAAIFAWTALWMGLGCLASPSSTGPTGTPNLLRFSFYE